MSKKHYVIIASIAFICYFNTIFGTFVFDDSEAIVKNKDVLPSSPLGEVFQNDFWGTNISLNLSHKSYRPLTILTFRLNVFLSGSKLDARFMHLTNVILYAVLCALTYPVFKSFLFNPRGRKLKHSLAYFSSILFTVHPVHTEAVAALVGRADILSSILFLTAVLTYKRLLKNDSSFLFFLVIFVIFLAVLCKETAITALALLVVYEICYFRLFLNHFDIKKNNLWRFGLLLVSGVCILFLRLYVMNFEGPMFTKIDNPAAYSDCLLTRVLTYNYLYFLNILLLIWPEWLCFDWSMGCVPLVESLCDIRVIFVLVFWLLLLAVLYNILEKFLNKTNYEEILLGVSMLVIPFIPASNLFLKVGFVIAERTLLLPSLGFCFLVSLGLEKLYKRFNRSKLCFFVFYSVCVLLLCRSVLRNFDWLTEERLFKSALEVCPLNAKVHYNVAKVAADKSNKDLAVREYKKAIELNSDYEQAMNNLANLMRDEKKFEEAEVLLRRALEVRPNFAAAWMNLGIVLSNLNQPEEAEKCYLEAIHFRNKYPDCYYNLGNLYLDLRKHEKALNSWEKAVYFKPSHISAWSNTLVLLDSLRKFDKVLEKGKTALMHNPTSPALHFSIANTLGKLQEFEKAEMHFLEALNFSPNNALYYSNLGVLYHRWGRTEKAREMYRKALQIDPGMKNTENNLRKLLNS